MGWWLTKLNAFDVIDELEFDDGNFSYVVVLVSDILDAVEIIDESDERCDAKRQINFRHSAWNYFLNVLSLIIKAD